MPSIGRHIEALIIAFTIMLVLGFSFYGWGSLFSHILGINRKKHGNPMLPVWLGWAFILVVFQLLHFAFPINASVTIPIFLLGVAFLIPRFMHWIKNMRKGPYPLLHVRLSTIGFLVLLLGIFFWVSSRAMLSPTYTDSGLYHFNLIRWINTYPIVPGLGNLHSRLAYNQSFFVYAAALNFYPYFEYGRSIANSFLLLVLTIHIFLSLRPVFSSPSNLRKRFFYFAPDLLIIPILAYLGQTSFGLASPSPDLTSTLLELLIFIELVHGVAEWVEGQQDQEYRAVCMLFLAATAITIKLSAFGYSLAILGIILAYFVKTRLYPGRAILRIILPLMFLFLVWGLRGYILSGTPLYPMTMGYIPFEWSVPRDTITYEAHEIISWARARDSECCYTISNWRWFKYWFRILITDPIYLEEAVYPLLVSLLLLVLDLVWGLRSRIKKILHPSLEWLIFLPGSIGLIYWFFTAPDVRFVNATIWILAICSSLLFLSYLQKIIGKRAFIFSCLIVFVIADLMPIGYLAINPFFTNKSNFARENNLTAISLSGWYPLPTAPLMTRTTASGLVVYTPLPGQELCWDSHLLCTPSFNPNLRLRKQGDLTSGFMVPASP